MIVLGIETSCDETAVAVVEKGERSVVLSEAVKSQIPIHEKYGGVVPEIASRNHYEVIDLLTDQALAIARVKIQDVGLIALTQGPGLIGSLLVGLSFAKGLSFSHHIPLVPVDHIEAHIDSAFITNPGIDFPLVALVVSGGHTSLFYLKDRFQVRVIARTRDDAVGEVMDKIAKYFDLGYPGGPILDSMFHLGNSTRFSFTIPKMSDGSKDFSFSGYKTALLRFAKEYKIQDRTKSLYDLTSSFLFSVVDYLLEKAIGATEDFKVSSLIVAGGVSRNSLLRRRFKERCQKRGIQLHLPDPCYCTDNGAMIAWRGYEKYVTFSDQDYHDLGLNVYSRALFHRGNKHR